MDPNRPLVFACSGCSNVGQLTNQVALELNRRGIAEMSCLAGVGAEKAHFLKKLKTREVWIIDGCPIECALGIFNRLREYADVHIRLHDMGVRKHDPLPAGDDFNTFINEVLQYVDVQKNATPYEPFAVQAG
jgi:uncharacterized metal-binding protein